MLPSILNADDFRTYCLEIENPQFHYYPLDEYFKEQDFSDYQAARAWWPTDAPPALELPWLHKFAEMRQVYPGAVMEGTTTFASILIMLTKRVTTWLELEKRDVQYPNETKLERKARKAREATARHRTKGTSTNPAATAAREHARELYQSYLDTCTDRRMEWEQGTIRIANAKAAYEAAAAEAKRLEDSNGAA